MTWMRLNSSTDCLTSDVENSDAVSATMKVECVTSAIRSTSGQHWVQNPGMHTNDVDSSLEAESYQSAANEMV